MSLPDCARYMDVALRSVYVLIENGELPSFKIGRARRVLVADVDALLARKVREASL
jgi:excisionase family DNA binding protein